MQPTKYGFENRTLYIQLPLGLQYRICVPAAQDGLSGKAAPALEFAFEAEPHTVNDIDLHFYIGHGYGWRSKRKQHLAVLDFDRIAVLLAAAAFFCHVRYQRIPLVS